MKLKNNIAVNENGFLFDPNSAESYSLNKTGQLIIKLIAEGKTEAEITETVTAQYDVESIVLQRYLNDFTMLLQQMNLLQKEED